MDVLNESLPRAADRQRAPRLARPARGVAVWAAFTAWLVAAACLSMPPRRVEPSFPHRVHVVDNQLRCAFCHADARALDAPGMPPPELCATCHDRFDGAKPPERRVGAFYAAAGRYLTVATSGRAADVRFSHRAHVTDAGLACTACHAGIDAQDEVPLAPLARKADCMNCHALHAGGNDCGVCHTAIDRDWRPASHAPGWSRLHGERARAGSGASADQCRLCHEPDAGCNACHQHEAPRDHDQSFRRRTHGLQAASDRSRCQVCHTTDSCRQCHETTRPRSHRAGFGAPQHGHCGSCHLPLAGDGCAVCHQGAPSHALAAPLPAGHSPAMNCRLCHGNGVSLPHPDGGHACTACHR